MLGYDVNSKERGECSVTQPTLPQPPQTPTSVVCLLYTPIHPVSGDCTHFETAILSMDHPQRQEFHLQLHHCHHHHHQQYHLPWALIIIIIIIVNVLTGVSLFLTNFLSLVICIIHMSILRH